MQQGFYQFVSTSKSFMTTQSKGVCVHLHLSMYLTHSVCTFIKGKLFRNHPRVVSSLQNIVSMSLNIVVTISLADSKLQLCESTQFTNEVGQFPPDWIFETLHRRWFAHLTAGWMCSDAGVEDLSDNLEFKAESRAASRSETCTVFCSIAVHPFSGQRLAGPLQCTRSPWTSWSIAVHKVSIMAWYEGLHTHGTLQKPFTSFDLGHSGHRRAQAITGQTSNIPRT